MVSIATITELNTFLTGEHMAIQSYEHFLQNVEEQETKKTLQKIQKEHKMHALKIAEQIQNLGGYPINDPPLTAELMLKLKSLNPKSTNSLLKDAYIGEQRGIEVASKIVKGDLDQDSRRLIEEILHEDSLHLTILKDLISKTKH